MRTLILAAVCTVSLLWGGSASAQIVSHHPPLSPAEAAAVLRGSHSIADYTDRHVAADDGPRVYVMRSSPTAGPYGEFRRLQEPRRLDGTLLSDPPWEQYAYVGWSRHRFGARAQEALTRHHAPGARSGSAVVRRRP